MGKWERRVNKNCVTFIMHTILLKNKDIKPQIEQGVILWYLYSKNKEHLKVEAGNTEQSGNWSSTKPLFTHWYVFLNLFIIIVWMMCLGGMHAPHMCGGQRSTVWSQFSYSIFAWIPGIVQACHFTSSLTDTLNLWSFCLLWHSHAHS